MRHRLEAGRPSAGRLAWCLAAAIVGGAACGDEATVGGGFANSAECLEGLPRVSEGEISTADLAEQCEATVAEAEEALERYHGSSPLSVDVETVAPETTHAATAVPTTVPATAASTSVAVTPAATTSTTTTIRAAAPSTSAAPGGGVVLLPGLAPADVYLNLADAGYDCTGPETLDSRVMWSCVDRFDPLARVEIFGPNATSVSYIDATALASAPQSLEFVATVPFDGADPEAAREWVAEAVGNTGAVPSEASFGGIPYRVTSVGDAVVLQIGNPPS